MYYKNLEYQENSKINLLTVFQCCGFGIGGPKLFYPQDSGSGMNFFPDPRPRIQNITKIKFEVLKFMKYKVYFLEKYRKRRKITLSMNVYYSDHLIRQKKDRFILHLSFLCWIRDLGSGSWMTRKGWIWDKNPRSITLLFEKIFFPFHCKSVF
jgi:hypothetical protein